MSILLSKQLRTMAIGSMLAFGAGVAPSAMAAPVFEVDPNSLAGVTDGKVFLADFITGGSTALVTHLGGTTYNSVGYITYAQFSLNSSPVPLKDSLLGWDYGLYATFTQTFVCPSMLGVGVTCSVSSITLGVYADIGLDNTYTQATIGNAPVVTDVDGDDVSLGNANLVYSGLAGFNAAGGAYENVTTNFILTDAGKLYFTDPVPFYNLAFSNFNNTSQGIVCSPSNCVNIQQVAITQENGGTDFNRVPEPATLALMGLGLLGMGVARRRKM